MDLDQVEWTKPTERETYLVRIAIENFKDRENMRDELRKTAVTTNQSKRGINE